MSRWKKENPGHSAKAMREWIETDKGKAYKEKHRLYMKEYRKKNREKVRAKQREYYDNARREALEAYGGKPAKCGQCGESYLECLQIDHIENDGNIHRKQIEEEYGYKLGGNQILMWLKKNNYPEGFQILCANCNIKKEMEQRRKNRL